MKLNLALWFFITNLLFTVVHCNGNAIFQDWSKDDLLDYLNDNKINEKGMNSLEDLKNAALTIYNRNLLNYNKQYPWWKFWNFFNRKKNNLLSNNNYLTFNQDSNIYDWLFDTWDVKSLEHFLDDNKIKYDKNWAQFNNDPNSDKYFSKDYLLNLIKDPKNQEKFNKKYKSMGHYPLTKFFSDYWDTNSIKLWLDKFKIKYKPKMTKNDLIHLIKSNIYSISNFYEKERLNLLNEIQLTNRQLLNRDGKLREHVFNNWSNTDLEKWLQLHEIPLQNNLMNSHDYLVNLANENVNFLKDDLNWYLSVSKRQKSPFLEKTPEYLSSIWDTSKIYTYDLLHKGKKNVDNLINDTFLTDIENWPKERLKAFLDYRDVKYSYFITKRELIDLVKANRNKPLDNLKNYWSKSLDSMEDTKDWLVEKKDQGMDSMGDTMGDTKDWIMEKKDESMESMEDTKDWVLKKKDEIQDSDTFAKISNNLQDLTDFTSDVKDGISKKLGDTFNNWSVEDLNSYVRQFGYNTDSIVYSKDELVDMAKKNTQWFFNVKKVPLYKRFWYNLGYYYGRVVGFAKD